MKGRQITAADMIAQAAVNGSKRGAHKEQDETRHREKHVKKTRRDLLSVRRQHNTTVQGGRLCTVPTEGVPCTCWYHCTTGTNNSTGTEQGGMKYEAGCAS
jgi:hypothetical protein